MIERKDWIAFEAWWNYAVSSGALPVGTKLDIFDLRSINGNVAITMGGMYTDFACYTNSGISEQQFTYMFHKFVDCDWYERKRRKVKDRREDGTLRIQKVVQFIMFRKPINKLPMVNLEEALT